MFPSFSLLFFSSFSNKASRKPPDKKPLIAGSQAGEKVLFSREGSSSDQTVDIGPISEDKYYILSADKTNGKYTVTDVTEATAIDSPKADIVQEEGTMRVYALSGQLLRIFPQGTSIADALRLLPSGLYLINGQKVVK